MWQFLLEILVEKSQDTISSFSKELPCFGILLLKPLYIVSHIFNTQPKREMMFGTLCRIDVFRIKSSKRKLELTGISTVGWSFGLWEI